MQIKKELLHQELGKHIHEYILDTPPNYENMINHKAVIVLEQIQELFLQQEIECDDFLLVDNIISILNHNGIHTGICHDF